MNTTLTQIKHRCGHTAAYNIKKRGADRWLMGQLCPECRRTEEARSAATFERLNRLPPLRGSAKQTAWAAQIRCRIIDELLRMRAKIPAHMRDHPKALAFERLITATRSCTSAKAWIKRADFRATSETINAILTKGNPHES